MSPEAFEPLLEQLWQRGAKDVFNTPIMMKKSRPGVKLTVLASVENASELADCILNHSTSIGVRSYPVTKTMLPRQTAKITTSLGDVRVKIVDVPDGTTRWKVEHDDIRAIGEKLQLGYNTVKEQIDSQIRSKLT